MTVAELIAVLATFPQDAIVADNNDSYATEISGASLVRSADGTLLCALSVDGEAHEMA